MTTKKLRGFFEYAYMLCVCAFLLWDIPYMTEAQWTFDIRGAFPVIWYGLAAMSLALRRMRPGVLWLPTGLLAWIGAMSVWRGVLDAQSGAIAHGVLAFLIVLPAPYAVRFDRLTRCLRCLLAAWTAFLTMQAAVGLWAALTGHAVFSLKGTWYIGVNLGDNRLYLNAYVTTGAVKMGLSALLAILGAALSRRRLPRVLYVVCAAVQLLCLSLTDCRTAFIAVGAGLGAAVMVLLLHAGKPGEERARRLLRLGCAALAVPVMTAGAYVMLSGTLTALAPHVERELDNINMLELPAHLLPEAAAEAAGEAEAIQHRELQTGNLFNDRQIIWTGALRLLRKEPKFLLTGTTMVLSPVLTNAHILPGEYAGKPFVHVHNIYLQTLVAWGLPGFAMLAAFLAGFLLAAWRVLFRHDLPLWQRLVPIPTLYVLLCDMVDCFTRLAEGSPMLLFGCFFAGLTLAVDARARHAAYAAAPVRGAADVIIPVYNAADYVARAVRSALEAGAARVILVDDGSTDGSAAACDELAARDERVTALHQCNGGAAAARNAGLDAAEAEFVMFLDADDQLMPGALAALTARIGDADAIQGRVVRGPRQTMPGRRVRRLPAREALSEALCDPTRHLLCHGWLLRRGLLSERFDERLTMGEDGEWMLRTLSGAKTAAFCDVPAYCYTLRAGSALHSGAQNVSGAYLATLSAAEKTLTELHMPASAALYRLTHLLLMLTHGDMEAALMLRDEPLFDAAFREARLTGLSPRMLTLRLLRRRAFRPVRIAVRIRRWRNGMSCAKG